MIHIPARCLEILPGLIALFFLFPGSAEAKPDPVLKALSGKIIVTADELPAADPDSPAKTIKQYRGLHEKVLPSTSSTSWDFNVTGFFKSAPKTTSLGLEFYTDDKEKLFVADKRLTGADPKGRVLSTRIRINEDDNLNANRAYVIKFVAHRGKKTVVLAEARVKTTTK